MDEYCNGLPPISLVPGLTACENGPQSQGIGKLPLAYPETLLTEALQDSYKYTDTDFALDQTDWMLTAYTISGASPTGSSVVESTCSASQVNPDGDGTYYTYYNTVMTLQGDRAEDIAHAWLVYPLTCDDVTKGISKGPAALIIDDLSILPSPTVTPGTPAINVRVNSPWHNVLRCSKNNIIYAPAPSGRCLSGKWTLQYSKPGAFPKISWKCEGQPEDESGDPEDYSFDSWPSDYDCSGVTFELSLHYAFTGLEINYDMSVTQLQRITQAYGYGAPFELYVDVTCTKYFPGGVLVLDIDNPDPDEDEIRPRVMACFPDAFRAKTINIPIGIIDPSAAGTAKKRFRTRVDMGALPCSSNENYQPCCENDSENVSDTEVRFNGYLNECYASVHGCVVKVSCEDMKKPEEDEYTGYLTAIVLDFVDEDTQESITDITMGTCGYPIPPESVLIRVAVSLQVDGGKYCVCAEEHLLISLSASNVSAQFREKGELVIPPGVYEEGTTIASGLFDVIITGDENSDECEGYVEASVADSSTELYVNRNCECLPPPSSDSRDPTEITCDGLKGVNPINVYYDYNDGKCAIALGSGAGGGICDLLVPGAGIAIDPQDDGKCEIRVTDEDQALAGIICEQLKPGSNINITPDEDGRCRIDATYSGAVGDICDYLLGGEGIQILPNVSGGKCQIVNTAKALPISAGSGISVASASTGYTIYNTGTNKKLVAGSGISVSSATNSCTIYNTAMDKKIVAGSGISVASATNSCTIYNTAQGGGNIKVAAGNGYISVTSDITTSPGVTIYRISLNTANITSC